MRDMTKANQLTQKIIPGLQAEYQIISMPYWAWFWLEDFMRAHNLDYKKIYQKYCQTGDIHQTLYQLANIHQDLMMREIHHLANDNEANDKDILHIISISMRQKKEQTLPKIYKLFGFMPCATTLEAAWKRRNSRKKRL